jgi:Arc/MetJ-type ribon-helix-helix transcriptional regulator
MSTTAGTLTIDIAAGIARLQDDVEKGVKAVEKGMSSIDKSVSLAKEAIAAFGVALTLDSLAEHLKRTYETIDATVKMGDRFNVAAANLMALQAAAREAGIADVTPMLDRLAKSTIAAAEGVEKSVDAFARLKLNATELSRLSMDKQFEIVGERLMTVGNITERNALTMEIFGRRSNEVINIFAGGKSHVKEWAEFMEQVGAKISDIDARKIEIAHDAMERAKVAAQGVFQQIAIELSPAVLGLANNFNDAAKQTHGFREAVVGGMELIGKAVGIVGDIVQGLQMVWYTNAAAAMLFVNATIDGIRRLDMVWTDFYNKVATSYVGQKLGMEAKKYSESLQDAFISTGRTYQELEMKLEETVSKGLFSDRVKAAMEALKKEIQQQAKALDEERKKANQGDNTPPPNLALQKHLQKEEDEYRLHLAKKGEELKKSLLTERQLEDFNFNQKMATLFAEHSQGLLSEADFFKQREQLELQHQAALGDIVAQGTLARQNFVEMSARQQTQTVVSQLLEMTQGVATHNKAMFEINKIAGIANAVINTSLGVTKALSSYPPPLSLVMAAVQFAAGMAQVEQIKSAQFGGGTSAPSVGGGAAVPVTPAESRPPPQLAEQLAQATAPAAPERTVQVTFIGSGFSAAQIRDEIIPGINEAVGDGVRLFVST